LSLPHRSGSENSPTNRTTTLPAHVLYASTSPRPASLLTKALEIRSRGSRKTNLHHSVTPARAVFLATPMGPCPEGSMSRTPTPAEHGMAPSSVAHQGAPGDVGSSRPHYDRPRMRSARARHRTRNARAPQRHIDWALHQLRPAQSPVQTQRFRRTSSSAEAVVARERDPLARGRQPPAPRTDTVAGGSSAAVRSRARTSRVSATRPTIRKSENEM